uniref:Uncharacterized protein n=1 Tax=Caenorhabditis japonica TaxID=281687 RepID=A0A8R1IGX0_CAEJA
MTVQAYSMLAGQHSTEVLAEHMRLRWLADGRFGPLAANILMHIYKADTKDISLSSNVLALMLNDYRNRLSTAGILLSENGRVLHDLNSYLVERLIVKLRHKLITEDPVVTKHVRQIFLHVSTSSHCLYIHI